MFQIAKYASLIPVICLFSALVSLKAQTEKAATPRADEPKPHEPLVMKAPDTVIWRVTTRFKNETTRDASGQNQPKSSIRTVRKSGKVIQEIMQADGRTYESYVVGIIRISDEGTKGTANIVSLNDWIFPEYGDVDFDRLRWVNMSNFKGVEDYQGRKVFVFRTAGDEKKLNTQQTGIVTYWKRNGSKGIKPAFLSDSVARLDIPTQLPVQYSDGEVEETYEYFHAPSTPFTVPEIFRKKLDRYIK